MKATRWALWKEFIRDAGEEDYPLIAKAFIQAVDVHLQMRVDRGELELQRFAARTPRLNREFMEIFREQYSRLHP